MKRFLMYALRWQCSTPVLALCVWLIPLSPLIKTIIANLIGSMIFYKVDKLIFRQRSNHESVHSREDYGTREL